MKSSHAKALASSYLSELLNSTFEGAPTLAGERAMSVDVPRELWDRALLSPLTDFLERPSKQFRARLVETAHRLAGARSPLPNALPQIVEMVHAGSLIVDDIEDDSEERRGAPALHTIHGMPLALNAGNWLYFWALTELARLPWPPRTQLEAHRRTSAALLRCHQGQALDLAVVIHEVPPAQIRRVVAAVTQLKTGCLMELAATLGALAADADQQTLDALGEFGRELGTGLQMLDDLGSLVSPQRRDKGDEDLRAARPTWPWAWLVEGGDEVALAAALRESARVRGGAPTTTLRARLRTAVEGLARSRVDEQLDGAFEKLRARMGEHPALSRAEQEIARLRSSYG
jgi:geranylgeranyl pyrophosphate synthase